MMKTISGEAMVIAKKNLLVPREIVVSLWDNFLERWGCMVLCSSRVRKHLHEWVFNITPWVEKSKITFAGVLHLPDLFVNFIELNFGQTFAHPTWRRCNLIQAGAISPNHSERESLHRGFITRPG